MPLSRARITSMKAAYSSFSRTRRLPAAHTAREAARGAGADPAAAAGFARLHRLSGILNVIVMASGILVLVMETVRRR